MRIFQMAIRPCLSFDCFGLYHKKALSLYFKRHLKPFQTNNTSYIFLCKAKSQHYGYQRIKQFSVRKVLIHRIIFLALSTYIQ